MGHNVLKCKLCGTSVMEGHNDWECDCGGYCGSDTNFIWVKTERKEKKDEYSFTHSDYVINKYIRDTIGIESKKIDSCIVTVNTKTQEIRLETYCMYNKEFEEELRKMIKFAKSLYQK